VEHTKRDCECGRERSPAGRAEKTPTLASLTGPETSGRSDACARRAAWRQGLDGCSTTTSCASSPSFIVDDRDHRRSSVGRGPSARIRPRALSASGALMGTYGRDRAAGCSNTCRPSGVGGIMEEISRGRPGRNMWEKLSHVPGRRCSPNYLKNEIPAGPSRVVLGKLRPEHTARSCSPSCRASFALDVVVSRMLADGGRAEKRSIERVGADAAPPSSCRASRRTRRPRRPRADGRDFQTPSIGRPKNALHGRPLEEESRARERPSASRI